MRRFPILEALAKADIQEVIRLWEGLGYYSRARNLHRAAQIVEAEHGGKLPSDYQVLRTLPGIGDYTASAILSIAFDEPYPVLDANVRRVMQRWLLIEQWDKGAEGAIRSTLIASIPKKHPGAFNEALMELGQVVCRIRQPECGRCPIAKKCGAKIKGLQKSIPLKRSKVIERLETTVLIYLRNQKVLLTKRNGALFKGLWLFPTLSGSSKPPETIPEISATLKAQTHRYTRFADQLSPVVVERNGRSYPQNSALEEGKWVAIKELEHYPMPSAYRKIARDFCAWYDMLD